MVIVENFREESHQGLKKMKNHSLNFEEIFSMLKNLYEELSPFNKILNIKVQGIGFKDLCVRLDMKDDLIGNFAKGILHGGVTAAVLDLTGGLIASVGILKRMDGHTRDEILNHFTQISTIDLRVDYLRAGKGNYFLTQGSILRIGNKVAVVRTELKNDQSDLIAAGTGTYLVG